MNADSDSLQSRACFPRARRRLSGANLHSPRLPALRALERARSQSPPSTSIHTRWLPCRPRASSRRASARARADPRAAPETRIAPASRARDPPTRRAARLDLLACARPRGGCAAGRRSNLALAGAACADEGGGAVGLLALLVPVAGFLAFQAGKGGGAAGDDDSDPPPPTGSQDSKNYQKNLTIAGGQNRKRRNPPKPKNL